MPTQQNKVAYEQYHAIGRRKSSIARAFLRTNGSGQILVNQQPLDRYFGRATCCMIVRQPLSFVEKMDTLDFFITVRGGGISGQAGAIRLAIARVLSKHGGEDVRVTLRNKKLLTCDGRRVESKKIGLHKARKRKQYRKR